MVEAMVLREPLQRMEGSSIGTDGRAGQPS